MGAFIVGDVYLPGPVPGSALMLCVGKNAAGEAVFTLLPGLSEHATAYSFAIADDDTNYPIHFVSITVPITGPYAWLSNGKAVLGGEVYEVTSGYALSTTPSEPVFATIVATTRPSGVLIAPVTTLEQPGG